MPGSTGIAGVGFADRVTRAFYAECAMERAIPPSGVDPGRGAAGLRVGGLGHVELDVATCDDGRQSLLSRVGRRRPMELLERTSHLSELRGLLRQAAVGRGRLVLLGGEAGVGKTALVRWFGENAAAARRFYGACDPLSTPRPLGPLLDIAEATGGEMREIAATAGPLHRLFGAFLAELDRAPGPTLTIIEDVHWADEATLDLLRFLGRRLGAAHGLVIATYRDDEIGPTHPLQVVLGDLATAAAARRMAVAPLSLNAVALLAAGSRVDPNALHERTGGNPFFVTEALAAADADIPATVRDAVLSRAARLTPIARTVLDAAAVIGSPIEPWLLAAVVDPAAAAAEECLASGMLRAKGGVLEFRHELAREAIHAAIPLPRRLALHARVLSALASSAFPNPSLLAYHAEEAFDREAVQTYAPLAAERAAAVGAHREAALQYARALQFAGGLPAERRGELLDAYSRECALVDQVAAGIAAGEEALRIWREREVSLRQGDSLIRLSRLYWLAGRREEAERAAWDALAILQQLPPGRPLALAYSTISQLSVLAWDADGAIAWGRKAIALAERLGDTETLVHALNNVGMSQTGMGDACGRDLVARSLCLAREADLEEHAARAYGNLGVSLVVDYRFAEADAVLDAGAAYCAERDLDQQRLYILAWRALSLFHQGRWADAIATAHGVLRERSTSLTSRIIALVAIGRARVRQGDPRAEAALDEALALAEQTAELQRLGPVRVARAETAWLAGDHRRVIAEAQETLDHVLAHKHQWLVGELAFWLWRAGALDRSPPLTQEPFALQIAGKWSQAAARWRALGLPYEEAWALADADDEPHLRRAHAAFLGLGAAPAALRVARRLRRMGVRGLARGPRPMTRANPARLTRRQGEILGLLAEGRTNAEIADRLFLSPRTVAHHVSAILAKLGVASRAEAVREAARRGVGAPTQNGPLNGPK